jgi:hypothetical protein
MFPVLTSLKLHHEESRSYAALQGWESLLESQPRLRTLGIFESAISFGRAETVKSLTSLTLYESRYGWQTIWPALQFSRIRLFINLSHLEFQGEKEIEQGRRGTVTQLLRSMMPATPALRSIKFKNGPVDGQQLISIVNDATTSWFFGSQWPRLEELTFSDTSGITRIQCDKLRTLVKTLHVYVN